ncbi:MAG: long-chain acyl-CoA synthetase [Burkholderiales bacterium]|nr:MAG: long-chain acyl-CoA synthetase [Burkholderiales bacterium]
MSPSDRTALVHAQGQLSRQALDAMVQRLARDLTGRRLRAVGTLLDNGPAWVAVDLALALAGIVHVPLPVFFTPAQMQHALAVSGADGLITSAVLASGWSGLPEADLDVAGESLRLIGLPGQAHVLPEGTTKITFTSGSTGQPKGVCLSQVGMQRMVQGLVVALAPLNMRRHLCALPLPVLLENMAGVLAPLAHGSECVVLPLHQLGLSGSSRFDPAVFDAAVRQWAPCSLILLPQMLRAWTDWLQTGGRRAPPSLKLVAVGGAAVGERLIRSARAVGVPAHEGYGLSEGGSVQTLNLPGADRPGSAGRPLPHTRLRVDELGQIHIAGSLMAGYLGGPALASEWWPTGDIGHLDADGFLHVQGRLRNVLITSYGRNVSPEWVESALREEPLIAQAVVFGEGQPSLSAVVWSSHPQATDAQLDDAVQAANEGLPDYAQVGRWVRGCAPFDASHGMATANGRPQRETIYQRHVHALTLPTE